MAIEILQFVDAYGNKLAIATYDKSQNLYLFQVEPDVQEVTQMCFPPMTKAACLKARALLEQIMEDTGH